MTASEFMSIAPMFASEDVCRPALRVPFRHGNHLFATDGRIAFACEAYGLDADEIKETHDEQQRNVGRRILDDNIKPVEAEIDSGKYSGFGLCSIGEAVCAAFANVEPEMMALRANEPDEDDPCNDFEPDSVRLVHERFTAVIMANPARSFVSGYYASLIYGLMRNYGPVEAYADRHDPHARLYFRGDNWRCVLMPRLVSPRGCCWEWNYYGGCAIADASTGDLVWRRTDGVNPDIDALRSGNVGHAVQMNGGAS